MPEADTPGSNQEPDWYVHAVPPGEENGRVEPRRMGPFRLPILRIALQNRLFTGTDLFWKEGYEDWRPGKQCSELKDLFPGGTVTEETPREPGLTGGEPDEPVPDGPDEPATRLPELKTTPHEFGQFVNFPDQWWEEYGSNEEIPGRPSPPGTS